MWQLKLGLLATRTRGSGIESIPRPVKYAIVGVLNTLVDLTIFVTLTESLGISPKLANIVSYSAGILVSFVLNRRLVFRYHSYHHGVRQQLIRFAVVNLLSLAISTTLVVVLSAQVPPLMAKLLSIPPVFVWGFLCTRRIVFSAPTLPE